MTTAPISCSVWAAHMPSTFYFSSHLQSVLPLQRQMIEKASFLPVWAGFEFVNNGEGNWSPFYLFFCSKFHWKSSLKQRKQKQSLLGLPKAYHSISGDPVLWDEDELLPRLQCERWEKLIDKTDALTLAHVCSVPWASALIDQKLKKSLPIISTLWAESPKEKTCAQAFRVQTLHTASDSIILLLFDLKRP